MKKIRTIYDIARAELQTIFYSPIAWLILIIFTFQVAMAFYGVMEPLVRSTDQGYPLYFATERVFANNFFGIFKLVQQYLYLYIPLLTMGLMSREYSNGSIKLLTSSPVTNTQIALGKYLSMMIYGLVLIAVLGIFVVVGAFGIKAFDYPMVLSGLLGLYLLICAYSAIGLFMSSITSYQVVAAMGTLGILAALNYVNGVWQDIEFVRDITYWLSISGRCNEFINGLICSEDVVYFIVLIAMFLLFTTTKLNADIQRRSRINVMLRYTLIFLVAMSLGYLSSRPRFMAFYDTTATKTQTPTPATQEIISNMKGRATITTYVNLLDPYCYWGFPNRVNEDMARFRQYRRFKPDIEMKYVYYWDKANNPYLYKLNPDLTDEELAKKTVRGYKLDFEMFLRPEQIHKMIDLEPEYNRFVRVVERETGEKAFLRIFDDTEIFPREQEIAAAFKRVVMPLPKVGFVTGHGERDCGSDKDQDYNRFAQDKPFRHSLINKGFDFLEIDLSHSVPDSVNILVIAEMKSALTAAEAANLDAYIARGGNMLIAGEPRRQEAMNPIAGRFGVEFMPGCIVKIAENLQPDLQLSSPSPQADSICYAFRVMRYQRFSATMPGVTALDYSKAEGYTVTPIFVTDSTGCWNELQTTDFLDEVPVFDSLSGERRGVFVTGVALSRPVNGREQRIAILGDADCLSNAELSISRKDVRAANYSLITGTFYWLSDDEVPVNVSRPNAPDDAVLIGVDGIRTWRIVLTVIFPALLLATYLLIWIRRKGR